MPKTKACEIFRQIFRVLQNDGILLASFFHTNYFKMPIGKSQAKQERPDLKFERVPVEENIQIVSDGKRRGEIRRFYNDQDELKKEIIEGGFKENNIEIKDSGEYSQVLQLKAIKSSL